MKKLLNNNPAVEKINLKSFFFDVYDKSDLQKIGKNNPLPHKCKIDGQEFYYYNADLSGLMWLPGEDSKLKYSGYIDVYRSGFADGLKHLKSKEGIKRKDFYNANKIDELKRVFHSFLYTREFIKNQKGLKDLSEKLPLIWTEERIHEEGYYNGLLHSILTLCDELNIGIFESTVNEKEKAPAKTGRPPAPKISAIELLKDKIYNKDKFLLALKNEYGNAKPRIFVFMLRELLAMNYIEETERVTLYDAFETEFGKTYSKENNKNRIWKNDSDSALKNIIKIRLPELNNESII